MSPEIQEFLEANKTGSIYKEHDLAIVELIDGNASIALVAKFLRDIKGIRAANEKSLWAYLARRRESLSKDPELKVAQAFAAEIKRDYGLDPDLPLTAQTLDGRGLKAASRGPAAAEVVQEVSPVLNTRQAAPARPQLVIRPRATPRFTNEQLNDMARDSGQYPDFDSFSEDMKCEIRAKVLMNAMPDTKNISEHTERT